MSWDAVLPVVTLILGYLGSLHTESRRDQREWRRAERRAIAELERAALLEAQDMLAMLPGRWGVSILAVNDALERGESAEEAILDVGSDQNRVVTLLTRVADVELQDKLMTLLIHGVGEPWREFYESLERGEKIDPRFWDRWAAGNRATRLIAERLRSSLDY